MNKGLEDWLKNYVGAGHSYERFDFSVFSGRKPTLTTAGTLYVGRGWLKRRAKKNQELMKLLVMEEI